MPPRSPEGGVRVLHFPTDQYQGRLRLLPEPAAMWDPKHVGPSIYTVTDAGKAQGDVTVPADRAIMLGVGLGLDPQEAASLRAREPETYRKFVTDRKETDPHDLSGLSALDANDLYMLSISQFTQWPTADEHVLEPITHLTGLRVLGLGGTGVTDKGMGPVRALRQLQAITFSQERHVKNEGLAVLKDLPNLQILTLDTGTTDAGLKHVAQIPNLRWLQIRMVGSIWGPALAELAHAPRLERLCLCGDQVQLTDRQITYLEGLTQLKGLTLWGIASNLTDASLASIAKLENLEELYFSLAAPKFTPQGLAHLKRLKKLKKVDFAQTWAMQPFTFQGDEVVRQLATMPQLESIERVSYLSDEGVKTLATFQDLKCLEMSLKDQKQDYHGPTGLSHLTGLDALEELRIATGDVLSEADLAGLEHLSGLKDMKLLCPAVTDDGLALIGQLEQLEYLTLNPVKRSDLNRLNGLSNLQTLNVHGFGRDPTRPVAFDEGTLDLSGLKKVKNLTLTGLPLYDEDLAFLERLPALETLRIDPRGPLPGSALRHCAKLPELNDLWVNKLSRCTSEDVASLRSLPKLHDLTLIGQIPDATLASLGDLPSLHFLNVHTPAPIQPQTIANVRQRLAEIEYFEFHDYLPWQQSTPPQRQNRSGDNATRRNPRSRRRR